jgi:hypothetical protein
MQSLKDLDPVGHEELFLPVENVERFQNLHGQSPHFLLEMRSRASRTWFCIGEFGYRFNRRS